MSHRSFFVGLLVTATFFSIATAVVFWHRVQDPSLFYNKVGYDTDGTRWHIWARTFTDSQDIYFSFTNKLLAYPFGYDVSYIPFFNFIYEIEIFSVQLLGSTWENIILVSNVSSLLAYPLTAIAFYVLAYYISRNAYASFIGAAIFSFSFYFVLMGRGSLAHNHLEFIPLYFLSLFYFLREKSFRAMLLSGMAFAILFGVNAYWAFFSGIFSVILLIALLQEKDYTNKFKKIVCYYGIFFLLTIALNFYFIFSQFFLFGSEGIEIANKASDPFKQVVDLPSFFLPSEDSYLYSGIIGNNFLGYTALLFGLLGIPLFWKKRLYMTLLVCFLLAIWLSSYVPGMFWLNLVYFNFFEMFRSVSRLNIFATFFLSLMSVLTLCKLSETKMVQRFFLQRWAFLRSTTFLVVASGLLGVYVIFEGLNSDSIWHTRVRFDVINSFFEPLKESSDIKVIAQYPMRLSNKTNGFPPRYQIIGQIIHNKPLVSGAGVLNEKSLDFYFQINDITKESTIDELAKRGVDTIVVHPDYLKKEERYIVDELKADERLSYKGNLERSDTEEIKNIPKIMEVFSIKKVSPLQDKLLNNSLIFRGIPAENVEVTKKSFHTYRIHMRNVDEDVLIQFYDPSYSQWSFYAKKQGSRYFDNKEKLNIRFEDSGNEYANIGETTINLKQFSRNEKYIFTNPDGSYDMDVILHLDSYSRLIFARFLFIVTIIAFITYIMYSIWSERRKKR